MLGPADIAEQRRRPEYAEIGGTDPGKHRRNPLKYFVAMHGEAAAALGKTLARRDQRVLAFQIALEAFEKQPFAQSVAGDNQRFRLRRF